MVRPSLGLIGRVVAILLLAMGVEFALSTVLYERASQFSVRDDEGRRLAEHLVIARRLIGARPPAMRTGLARDFSTVHYVTTWRTEPPGPSDAALARVRARVLTWEPALRDGDLRLHLERIGGRSYVAGAAALPDGSWLHFRTAEALDGLDLFRSRILVALAVATALMVLGGALIGRTLRPMRQLADAADRFGTSDQRMLAEEGPGEVRRVIVAFNRMQARIRHLIEDRTEALAAVGHDIRTPLARLRLRADAIEQEELRDELIGDVTEMDTMVDSLLAFLGGEDDPEKPVLTDLAVLCATLADDAADRGFAIGYVGPDHLDHACRALTMKRAISNLVENALHHADVVTIVLSGPAGGWADAIVIAVEDDGPGIAEDALQRVMEPFVRLDTARRRTTSGLGLGLAIAHRAAQRERGELTLANLPGGGLRAEIRLPRRPDMLPYKPAALQQNTSAS